MRTENKRGPSWRPQGVQKRTSVIIGVCSYGPRGVDEGVTPD